MTKYISSNNDDTIYGRIYASPKLHVSTNLKPRMWASGGAWSNYNIHSNPTPWPEMTSWQTLARNLSYKHFMISQFGSCENILCINSFHFTIRSQICTCRDSSAVAACAKLWPDLIIIWYAMITSGFTRCGLWAHKPLWNGSQATWCTPGKDITDPPIEMGSLRNVPFVCIY